MRRRCAFLCLLGLATLVSPSVGARAPTGALRIRTQPDVRVIWDGTPLGSTDQAGAMRIDGIPPGQYQVQLRRDGYEPIDATVAIGAGESTLEFQLQSLVATPEPPAVVSGAARDAGKTPRSEETSGEEPVQLPAVAPAPVPEPAQANSPPPQSASRPESTRAASVQTQSARQAPSGSGDEAIHQPWLLSVYVALGLLLAGLGVHRVYRRTRPRGILLQGSAGPFRTSSSQSDGTGRPSFFEELKRREVALDQFVDTGRGVQRREREGSGRGEFEEGGE